MQFLLSVQKTLIIIAVINFPTSTVFIRFQSIENIVSSNHVHIILSYLILRLTQTSNNSTGVARLYYAPLSTALSTNIRCARKRTWKITYSSSTKLHYLSFSLLFVCN